MITCSKCKIEKEDNQYATYFHSSFNKTFTRKICKLCFNLQKSEYRKKKKMEKIQIPTQQEIIQPEVLKLEIEGKVCKQCNEFKPYSGFYKNNSAKDKLTSKCRKCVYQNEKKDLQERLKEKGGSELVLKTPGKYMDKFQEEGTAELMTLLGYIKHETKNIWLKPGVKELIDGKIVFMKVKKPSYGKIYRSKVTTKMVEQMIEYKKLGLTEEKIGDLLGVSDTTVGNYTRHLKLIKNEE
jgi:hypothetical protein